ncbi:MAG: tRNA pseudouridine(55) synthase TruB [Bacteroidales bacterium]|nr:tRNA pseudouridine(55) synthase TruB [Bacteroidales bacterium]MDD2424584.1 tRNA pseudouridine(55) synthase TruB [Bacteroidales bacterium]MDD3988742.1 tRNA pseudouridine(55) synthase TruB [Bacteroidales bacterium]MDD4638707.1 tRNA pseudouridine(55) synthase TruB [Bacteroidales bacterium]
MSNKSFTVIDRFSETPFPDRDIQNYPGGLVIPLDKPYKWSSADAVRKIKFRAVKFFGLKNLKVGHAGTLDPLATGLLLICIGSATKRAGELQEGIKEYIAGITFGYTTPSFDLEKDKDADYPYSHINQELIEETLKQFTGLQQQIPPSFSAKMVNGQRSYMLAREGDHRELTPSLITIHELEIISFASPLLLLRVLCSKGTYIRSLARDLGTALNSGATLTSLTRTRSGDFTVSQSISIEKTEEIFSLK